MSVVTSCDAEFLASIHFFVDPPKHEHLSHSYLVCRELEFNVFCLQRVRTSINRQSHVGGFAFSGSG